MDNNKLVLKVGQTSQASILAFLADGVTPSGGTVSNVTFTFDDPSATVTLNPDGTTATVSAVAESNGPISGNVHCTVTDTDEAVSNWDQQFTIEVQGGAPPDQLTQSVAVQFSDPVDGGPASTGSAGTVSPAAGIGGRLAPQQPRTNAAGAPLPSGKRPVNE